jgi:hypothetical protein
MITDRDERWTFGHALNVEDPNTGIFERSTLYSKITINLNPFSNWVLASIPTPNVTKGWRISSVMLRYTIPGQIGFTGSIDKIIVRDGNEIVAEFENLKIWANAGWETLTLNLPQSKTFKFGLGVGIHVILNLPDEVPVGPSEIRFASVGLGFVKESVIVVPPEPATT